MRTPRDLKSFLDGWAFDPDSNVRIVQLRSGRPVMQVRLPVGMEQYELTGRPDGRRPHGMESFLAYHQARLDRAIRRGEAPVFRLSRKACQSLFDEAMLYYFRYLNLFQLQEWTRVMEDTDRNIALFDFVRAHAAGENDRSFLEQWRPYVLRVHAVSRAMIELEAERFDAAITIVRQALAAMELLPQGNQDSYQYELDRSISMLREMLAKIEDSRPLSHEQKLERELRRAVEHEAFEHAAEIRDRLNNLRTNGAPSPGQRTDHATPPPAQARQEPRQDHR